MRSLQIKRKGSMDVVLSVATHLFNCNMHIQIQRSRVVWIERTGF